MSQTYAAAIISILTVILPMFGVTIGTEELTSFIQAVVIVVSGIWVMVRRYKQGDINILGARK